MPLAFRVSLGFCLEQDGRREPFEHHQALGELGVSESAEAIVRDLDSKESKVRWAAIQALGRG